MKRWPNRWSLILVAIVVVVGLGVAVESETKLDPKIELLEQSLNDWSQFELQAVATQAKSYYLPSGETFAHIELHQEELSQNGYIAVWSREKSCFVARRNTVLRRWLRNYEIWRSKPKSIR